MPHDILKLGDRITILPVIHGSGDFALEVRRMMLENRFDCIAVPLPPSFQADVELGIDNLPNPTVVVQRELRSFVTEWTPDREQEDDARGASFVPIDPCQAVITALRVALGEHIPRAFIDLETNHFRPYSDVLPDPYALKKVPVHRFAAALLPTISRVPAGQPQDRVAHMARRLSELESRYESILFVCAVSDWPWVREAYTQQSLDHDAEKLDAETLDEDVDETNWFQPDPKTLIFMLGELPFITGLYERARSELEDDENLSVDGIKELLIAARSAYRKELKGRARKITPHMLSTCLKYVRNLTLTDRRFTPDLYTIVMAAKQVCGDGFALHVAETAREYPGGQFPEDEERPSVSFGVERIRFPDGEIVEATSRLPGPPILWRSCDLRRRPDTKELQDWRMQWNPLAQCSWPPEDELIENFRAHVTDRAKAIMGADLVRTEKFTTSIKDGIDIRDTLRNWHTGEIFVKVLPPNRGHLDAVVMLFDSPADPREYPWRTTWFAEHQNESTLAFFATDFTQEMVGPGIGLATYGGAMFLFPPVSIPDIWYDRRLDFTETLEERILAATCIHSQASQIALLSAFPPGAGWRRLARRFRKKWVHVPLSQFSDSTIQQLRMAHVLNGREVRSFASHFIRKS